MDASPTAGESSRQALNRAARVTYLRWIAVAALAVALAAGWRLGIGAGTFYGVLFALTAVAALGQPAGLLVLLSVAPFDGLIRTQMSLAFPWYPPALHVIDPIGIALLGGWGLRWVLGRTQLRWQWYDWAALACFAVLTLEAVRGILAGYDHVLSAARFIPALATYLPAREVFADQAMRRRFLAWVMWYGIAYGVVALVLAYVFRDYYGRELDILLPRICRLLNERVLLLLLFVTWAAIWRNQVAQRSSTVLYLAVVFVGALLAINNTRSVTAGVLLAWLILVALLVKSRANRWAAARIAGATLGAFLVGMVVVHLLNAAEPRIEHTIAQLRQPPVHQVGATARGPGPSTQVRPPAIDVSPKSIGTAMRVSGDTGAVKYPVLDRWRESVAVLEGVAARSFLIGRGIGAPVRYRRIEWSGEEVDSRGFLVHNSYLGLLHSSGLLGLGLILVWVGGVLAQVRFSPTSGSPSVPLLTIGGVLFVSTMLVTAVTIGNLTDPVSANQIAAVSALLTYQAQES